MTPPSRSPVARRELQEKAEKASPGPWHAATDPHPEAVRLRTEAASVYASDHLIYTQARDYDCGPETWERQRANAAFIAACSPDVILALCAALPDEQANTGMAKHFVRLGDDPHGRGEPTVFYRYAQGEGYVWLKLADSELLRQVVVSLRAALDEAEAWNEEHAAELADLRMWRVRADARLSEVDSLRAALEAGEADPRRLEPDYANALSPEWTRAASERDAERALREDAEALLRRAETYLAKPIHQFSDDLGTLLLDIIDHFAAARSPLTETTND